MLSEAQVAHYHENGFVIPDYRLSEETLDAIRDDHARLLRSHPEFHDYCPQLLAWDLSFLNYARDPEILDMIGQIIGPDFALWNSSFFAKPALNGYKTPWHQDGETGRSGRSLRARFGWRLTTPPWKTAVLTTCRVRTKCVNCARIN